ncbi:hypothetical protein [Flagellimonas amoyensis]|uniref:hypothetical protein n=1 Tax=Flagellimonas amoyensis TaxID=2169401 RepID=UPI000D3C9D41|nr:hypothetical protein [Allomuricauda amoyensis]
MLSLVFFALAFYFYVFSDQSLIDVNVHDTYYVVAYFDFFLLFGIWFALCGLGYWIVSKKGVKLYKWPHWAHVILSILPFVLLPVLVYYQGTHGPEQMNRLPVAQGFFILSLGGFVLGQVAYFLNILIATLSLKREV